jgi:hypothetical protein
MSKRSVESQFLHPAAGGLSGYTRSRFCLASLTLAAAPRNEDAIAAAAVGRKTAIVGIQCPLREAH